MQNRSLKRLLKYKNLFKCCLYLVMILVIGITFPGDSYAVSTDNAAFITGEIEPFSVNEGETFLYKELLVYYQGGTALLASDPFGIGDIVVDDAIEIKVTHEDGTYASYSYDFKDIPISPVDISYLFDIGKNYISIKLYDIYDMNTVCSKLWITSVSVRNYLQSVDDSRTGDNLWHSATVNVDEESITVYVTNGHVIDWTRGFGFSAGKGWSTNWHIIENVKILYPKTNSSPLAVKSTDPQDGTVNVAVYQDITVTFSEDVQKGINFSGITIKAGDTPVDSTKSITSNQLIIDPLNNLDSSTTYTVYIPASSVKDIEGNYLENDCTFSFTTDSTSVYTDDFSMDSGLWTYNGTAYRDATNGNIVLTTNGSEQTGNIWFNNNVGSPFTVEFKYKAGGGSGADGLTFAFYKNKNYTPGGGGELGFNDINGQGVSGYGIEFDNYDGGYYDPSANHIALIKDDVRNPLQSVNDSRTEDNNWHSVKVIVDEQSIVVYVDNDKVIDWTGNIDTTYNGFGFSAATGGFTNWHIIDDVKITIP